LEETLQIFKTANCSLDVKGKVVGKLKQAAAKYRAATSVLATRARDEGREEDQPDLQVSDNRLLEVRELRRENERLRRGLEEAKHPSSPSNRKRSRKRT